MLIKSKSVVNPNASDPKGKVFADVPQFNVTDIYESALAPDPVSISFTSSFQKAWLFFF